MNQKGSGGARHSTRKPNIFRGGGVVFGPKPRDYSTKLPKKIRSLGLKHALSSKLKNDELIILDEAKLSSPKTKDFLSKVKNAFKFDVFSFSIFTVPDNVVTTSVLLRFFGLFTHRIVLGGIVFQPHINQALPNGGDPPPVKSTL